MTSLLKITIFLAMAAAAAMVLMPAKASAGPALCGKRGDLIKVLEKKYKENRVAVGLSQKSSEAFEVFASSKGTWTVLMTTKSGITCIMASGHSWKDVAALSGQQS
ncbi:MAG: hypothetical protein AB3N20_12760 [Rhizobiaceae bacterium]